MTAKTLRVTTPTPTDIVLTRVFNAPRHLVFDTLTKPELLRRWFGARGWRLVECEVELRVGGSWRFVSVGPDGLRMGQGGVYREIQAPDRLVYTESYDDQWVPGESLVTTVLTERAGLTTLQTTLRYSSPEVRDLVLATPMERGVGESYDRLDEVLASR
ncbi:SRPBCC family protein [Salinispora pacifica]|uniref:SRPBCC family protein n=1 Tax=Salinispora pacifica TaxID=351187 RepID=UPI000374B4D4|nr:SRPBCC family protein [Salinispora pacifica]